jgi:hypothetical protein
MQYLGNTECHANRAFRLMTLRINTFLRRLFGLKMEDIVGGWRRLNNKEPHNLYASPNIGVDE